MLQPIKNQVLASALSWMGLLLASGCSGVTKSSPPPTPAKATDAAKSGEDSNGKSTASEVRFANPKPGRCVVSGDEIDAAVTAEVGGKTYAFCCPDCVDKFKAEPAKYLSAETGVPANGSAATPAATETQAVLFGKGVAHSLKIPKTWKSEPPANNLRLAQATAPKHPDDEEDAEFTVTKASGGVEANLTRWAKTLFNDEASLSNRRTLKTASEKEATLAEYEGTYTSMSFGPKKAEPKKNYKMLGAIVVAEDGEYFIRLTGPKQTVEKWKSAFEPLVLSFQ